MVVRRFLAFLITLVAVPFQLICLGSGYLYVFLDKLADSLWREQ